MTVPEDTGTWWGSYEVPQAEARRWQIGPLQLTAIRQDPEWRILYLRDRARIEGDDEVALTTDLAAPPADVEVLRIMSADARARLTLAPAAADRPLVVRPETSVLVLPGAKARLFLSTAVWVRVEVGEPGRKVLDVPSWRLSDTWFGPSPRQGELCYAVRTSARLHLENLPVLDHRAISEVSIENRTREGFSLERFKLPTPNLSLYADSDTHLWTQTVTVRLREKDALAEVDLGTGPPEAARDPVLVAGPRTEVARNILERAISGLFQ